MQWDLPFLSRLKAFSRPDKVCPFDSHQSWKSYLPFIWHCVRQVHIFAGKPWHIPGLAPHIG